MKKTILAVLLAALFIGLAAHPAINGWEYWELKGPVKEMTICCEYCTRYHFDPEGLITLEEFGLIASGETETWEQASKMTWEYAYDKDDAGRVVRRVTASDGYLAQVTKFFYDGNGNLARSNAALFGGIPFNLQENKPIPEGAKPISYQLVWWNEAGSEICALQYCAEGLISMDVYEYDGRGMMVRSHLFDEEEGFAANWRQLASGESELDFDQLPESARTVYEYDEEGRLTKETSDDGDYIKYKYSSKGPKLITRTVYYNADGSFDNAYEHYVIYNERGNIQEDDGMGKRKYEYLFY